MSRRRWKLAFTRVSCILGAPERLRFLLFHEQSWNWTYQSFKCGGRSKSSTMAGIAITTRPARRLLTPVMKETMVMMTAVSKAEVEGCLRSYSCVCLSDCDLSSAEYVVRLSSLNSGRFSSLTFTIEHGASGFCAAVETVEVGRALPFMSGANEMGGKERVGVVAPK